MVTERYAPENRCDWDVEAGARGDQDPLRVKELQREDLAARTLLEATLYHTPYTLS